MSEWKSLSCAVEKFTEDELHKYKSPLKTGFPRLDKLLGGGITSGLTVLGGVTNTGKSTFAIQLAQHMAGRRREEGQVPVLYFSLEMTAERIASKLLSSRLYRGGETKALWTGPDYPGQTARYTANDLVRGMDPDQEPWPPELFPAIEEARRQTAEATKELFIIEDPMSAEGIALTVKRFLRDRGLLSQEEGAPSSPIPVLVIVDYLQILPPCKPGGQNERQVVEDNVSKLCELSKIVPVLLISSLSRSSYKAPIEASSFKETGRIEYSADTLLGLQFQACHKGKDMSLDKEKGRQPREVEISILKQRYGAGSGRVPFRYYAEYDYFEEAPAPARQDPDHALEDAISQSQQDPDLALEDAFNQAQQDEDLAPEDAIGQARQDPDSRPGDDGAALPEAAPAGIDRSIPESIMCNTKIMGEIRQGAFGAKRQCQVFPGIYTEYTLTAPLTYFDCDVADAIYTIYTLKSVYKRDSFTVGQVMRVLSGDAQQTLTRQKVQAIKESIQRLRSASITIHCRTEFQQREGADSTRSAPYTFTGPFLSVFTEGNRYYFQATGSDGAPMPLYAYSEVTKQMIRFPRALLQIPHTLPGEPDEGPGKKARKLSDSAQMICIKHYLIRRIQILQYNNEQVAQRKRSRKGEEIQARYYSISFRDGKELYRLLRLGDRYPVGGNDAETRKQRKQAWSRKQRQLRGIVLEILRDYKKIGYIGGIDAADKNFVKLTGAISNPWTLPAICPTPDPAAQAGADEL